MKILMNYQNLQVILYLIHVQGTKEIQIHEAVEVLEIGTGFMMVERDVLQNGKKHILNLIIKQIIIVLNISRVIDIFMHILILLSIMINICQWDHLIIQIDICQKIICFVNYQDILVLRFGYVHG